MEYVCVASMPWLCIFSPLLFYCIYPFPIYQCGLLQLATYSPYPDDVKKYCLTGGFDRTVRLWNPLRLDAKSEALSIQVYRDGHVHPISAMASHDTVLLSASHKTFAVTDMVTAKVKARVSNGHDGRIHAVDILSRDSLYLTGSYDGTVKVWDARNPSRQMPLQVHSEAKDSVSAVQFQAPHSFYTASLDGQVRLYDVRQGRITCCNAGSPIVSMAIAYDDCLLVSCSDGCMRLLNKSLEELLNTFQGAHRTEHYAVACAMTSSYVVTGTEELGPTSAVLYDMVTSKVVQTLSNDDNNEKDSKPKPTCAIAAHDSCIVTANGNVPRVWTNDPSHVSRD
jgi:mitogen-activated protein kinase organizer 1